MQRMRPLPLLVLTGFLGSGKTSTLRHWLTHTTFSLKKTAVLINDFGEVNVDAILLAQRELALGTITGGCACCQSFGEMVEKVQELSQRPEIELAWVETSGMADPEEIIDHLTSPELHGLAELRRLILVIDGTDFPCSWRGRAVQEEQIRYADLLLLNKIDLLDEKARLRVELTLRKLNPQAPIISTNHGQLDPELLSQQGPRLGAQAHACCEHDHDHHHDHHHPHEHEDHLPHAASTFFLPLLDPVERSSFTRFLGTLPLSVFRAKGFVRFTESPAKIHAFQQVRDQAEVLLLPVEKEQPSKLGLVFIGPQLPETEIRQQAEKLLS